MWELKDNYLSAAFYDSKSTLSLPAFICWVSKNPITADGDTLALYVQVELVTLGFGLAFRALWVTQFPNIYSNVPAHIINCSYLFQQYKQLIHNIEDIITGYAEMHVPLLRLIICK
jgi:hypothetical protein